MCSTLVRTLILLLLYFQDSNTNKLESTIRIFTDHINHLNSSQANTIQKILRNKLAYIANLKPD